MPSFCAIRKYEIVISVSVVPPILMRFILKSSPTAELVGQSMLGKPKCHSHHSADLGNLPEAGWDLHFRSAALHFHLEVVSHSPIHPAKIGSDHPK